jgi:DNA-binding winged helix-turn-helix (wHTH) protein
MSQRQLLAEVWGPGYADAAGNLRLYMTQLRRKLEPDPARPRWLLTEPGMGYRYQPDVDEQQEEDVSLPRQQGLAHRRKSRGRQGTPGENRGRAPGDAGR